MKDKINYELRMMGLVPYNISAIQQGIQFGHAVVEYGLTNRADLVYNNWARNHKTFIILNGGTTNGNNCRLGTLNKAKLELEKAGVKIASFHEPDLGDQLTAVVFIVDERVFDRKKYPDYEDWKQQTIFESKLFGGIKDSATEKIFQSNWQKIFKTDSKKLKEIIFLRGFLKNYRLA
jgi:hypothetical protein